MDPYELLWMVLLIVFVLGELATIGLTCIWFAAGALAALVMAMAGINPVVQFLVFSWYPFFCLLRQDRGRVNM